MDALAGTACNAGSPDQGALKVAYGDNGAVTLTCVPTTLETLAVTVNGGNGSDSVTGDPTGISCTTAGESTCSAQYPIDNTVTLTAHPSGTDDFTGWGGACSGTSTSCTVKMSAAQNVSANFAIKHVLNFAVSIPPPLIFGGTPISIDLSIQPPGYFHRFTQGTSEDFVLVDDGAVARITANVVSGTSAPVTWSGACAGAVGNTCFVPMNSDQSFGVAVNPS